MASLLEVPLEVATSGIQLPEVEGNAPEIVEDDEVRTQAVGFLERLARFAQLARLDLGERPLVVVAGVRVGHRLVRETAELREDEHE
jgi:hypothetical protein